MKIKTAMIFFTIIICWILLFALTAPDSGLAQEPARVEWRRVESLPQGLIAGCQDAADYECGILCGREYYYPPFNEPVVADLGCVAYRFPITDPSGPGTGDFGLPITTTQSLIPKRGSGSNN